MYTVNALVYLLKVSGNMSQLSSRAQQFSSLFTGFGSKAIVHISLTSDREYSSVLSPIVILMFGWSLGCLLKAKLRLAISSL